MPLGGRATLGTVTVPPRPPDAAANAEAALNFAWPEFFETLDLTVVRGRTFADADLIGPPTAVVNEAKPSPQDSGRIETRSAAALSSSGHDVGPGRRADQAPRNRGLCLTLSPVELSTNSSGQSSRYRSVPSGNQTRSASARIDWAKPRAVASGPSPIVPHRPGPQ